MLGGSKHGLLFYRVTRERAEGDQSPLALFGEGGNIDSLLKRWGGFKPVILSKHRLCIGCSSECPPQSLLTRLKKWNCMEPAARELVGTFGYDL